MVMCLGDREARRRQFGGVAARKCLPGFVAGWDGSIDGLEHGILPAIFRR